MIVKNILDNSVISALQNEQLIIAKTDKPHSDKVGKITRAQLQEIAEAKKDQLNAIDIEGAMKVIAGSARSMGVEVVD